MDRIPASVGVLTFNSGRTLARTLASVRKFDDLVVCDGGSSDDTLAIAAAYGAHIIRQGPAFQDSRGRLINYAGVRNQCLDAAKHDWFLYIDSDETMSDGLRDEIRAITARPPQEGAPLVFEVPLQILMDKKPVRYSSNYPGYQMRFFNRTSGARFIRPVHEKVKFDRESVKVGRVKNPWQTWTSRYEWEHYLAETAVHRATEIRERCRQPLRDYLVFALGRNLRRSLAVFVKASWNYAIHGFSETLPVAGEFGRALAPLIVLWGITACRFNLPGAIVKRP